jgi:hypothetical protein
VFVAVLVGLAVANHPEVGEGVAVEPGVFVRVAVLVFVKVFVGVGVDAGVQFGSNQTSGK